ncbi:MAG TPA: uroporphyrinogen-III synthase [Pyrinomonadaceae bacterium]|nr:uroporphyrinogen-III synthase [Pyrinomonadaceae bacterium]
MAVLVLRREDEFSRTLTASGLSVINCPVIRTEPSKDLSKLREVASRLDDFEGIFVTSAAAAQVLANAARLEDYRGRVFVLGRRSFDILKHSGAKVVFDEGASSSAAMIATISTEELCGKRFLFVSGERSMRTIPELVGAIADVQEIVVYRTVNKAVSESDKTSICDRALRGEIAIACFFSPSGVESFAKQFGVEILRRTKAAAIGETTAAALRATGRQVDLIGTGDIEFASSVVQYLRPIAKGI